MARRSSKARAKVHQPSELRWRVLPCARDWRLTAATVALLLLVLCVVYLAFGRMGWVVVSAVFLFGSLAQFFLPTTYSLDDDGVSVQGPFGTTRRAWSALRSHRAGAQGVLLSPFSRPSRLEGFRGVHLRFQDNRDEVMALVTSRTEPQQIDKTASSQNE